MSEPQAIIQELLGRTNMVMAGKRVLILGYGPAGRAVADRIHAMGGLTWVADPNLGRLREAAAAGHRTGPGPDPEIVLALDEAYEAALAPPEAVLYGIHGMVDVTGLEPLGRARDGLASYRLPAGGAVHVFEATTPEAAPWRRGLEKIGWAARAMPVLNALTAGMRLDGLTVGLVLVLEPKTANLALALRSAGARVIVHCPGESTSGDVAEALAREGVTVYADPAATARQDRELALRLLGEGLDVLVDDGSDVIRLAHAEDLVKGLIGAAEETTSGLRPLRVMAAAGQLRIPVLAVNDARSKYLFDNVHGTGQSCVLAALDLTDLKIAGAVCAVAGYGNVGQGVARYARALGARVVVSEVDPFAALRAHHDGYEVRTLLDACHEADLVFSATGVAGTVTAEHLARLKPGAVVAVAGGVEGEVAATGRADIAVLAGGECVNCAAAEGNPIEIMDLSLSVQALAIDHLVRHGSRLSPGVHPMPSDLDERVARAKLAALGAGLDAATAEQRAFLDRGLS
ncbi:adenosylhomocysteinase [Streptosporangiaceae bacterium NEAU-GS5]|nr:adenosylhomocysteinase [Streptosporangiaceae bacterium NEAU-GS5]